MLNILLPQYCFLCGAASQQALCANCIADLPQLPPSCPRCGNSLSVYTSGQLCGSCHAHPPRFTALQAAFPYISPIKELIHSFKYQRKLPVLHCLGEQMTLRLQQQLADRDQPLPDVMIPVPIHWRRLQKRGYNQALELARVLQKQLPIPIAAQACIRQRNTLPQMALSEQERILNVRNAFRVKSWRKEWRYAVLIDDIVTIGATANELSRVLLAAGAERVEVWCCARA